MAQANALLRKKLLPEFNRRFSVAAARRRNAHRDLGPEHCLPRILCVQHRRGVDNDYTVRFRNRCFQLHPPAWPGLRRGKVVLEQRPDGKLLMRFGTHYLSFHEILPRPTASAPRVDLGGSAPPTPPEVCAFPADRRGSPKTRPGRPSNPAPQPTRRRPGP